MLERKNLVAMAGHPVTLLGAGVNVGDSAPEFTVVDNSFGDFSSKSLQGKVRVYNVVLSLDTSICDTQTRRFNEEAAALGDDVEIVTLSVDLPPAQKRWCGAAGIDKVKVLSDYRDLEFGKSFGVLIKENHLLARSVFVVDKQNVVRYMEIMPDTKQFPDYDKAIHAVKALL